MSTWGFPLVTGFDHKLDDTWEVYGDSDARCFVIRLDGVGKPHINISWSDDGSDENERLCRL